MLEALPYNYAFLCSPVVDPACMDGVIAAFFAAIEQSPLLPNVVSLLSLDAECPSYPAMLRELAARGVTPLMLSESARPFVTREFGVKRTGSTRKKLRQDWNRLSALGTVEVVNDRTPEAAELAFETFLALEKASWKGDQGTALLSDSKDAAFVRRLMQGLSAQGNASVALLRVDGEAIAAQVLMYCGTTAYTWKTAFSAKYSKYSPGALLIDRITEALFAGSDILAINSCAAEASFMGQLWVGRLNYGRHADRRRPGGKIARLPNMLKLACSLLIGSCEACATGSVIGPRHRRPGNWAWQHLNKPSGSSGAPYCPGNIRSGLILLHEAERGLGLGGGLILSRLRFALEFAKSGLHGPRDLLI